MLKHLCCDTPNRRVQVGWVSFMPDGAISIGSNEKTFIAPEQRNRAGVWNTYNRVKYKFHIINAKGKLEGIISPHFTYHPPMRFHLKTNYANDDEVFVGLADVRMAVEQDGYMPWTCITSPPISKMPTRPRPRAGKIDIEILCINWPSEDISVTFSTAFVPSDRVPPTQCDWVFPWKDVTLMISLGVSYPQISTLTWFHSA